LAATLAVTTMDKTTAAVSSCGLKMSLNPDTKMPSNFTFYTTSTQSKHGIARRR